MVHSGERALPKRLAASAFFIQGLVPTLGVALGPAAPTHLETEGHEAAFASFMELHERTYEVGSPEYQERLALFSARTRQVHSFNSQPNRRWTAGINSFADRTEEERAAVRGWRGAASAGGRGSGASSGGRVASFLSRTGRQTPLPSAFQNWTKLQTVRDILDQGSCGSCWAITSTTVLNAHAEIHTPASARAPKFSTQQLVSCVPNPRSCGGTGGCEGATVELAMDWVVKHGLATEQQEPYRATTGTCHVANAALAQLPSGQEQEDVAQPGIHTAEASAPGLSIGLLGWERLPENRYEPLLRAIVERGPVAVSVAAGDWFAYAGGIFDACSKDAVIDHAVTLVGFGVDNDLKEKFWEIQNSWGPSWGEDGKIRLLRQDGEETEWCGTDHQPEVGTGCTGGPSQVKVCGMCGILYDTVVPHFGRATVA